MCLIIRANNSPHTWLHKSGSEGEAQSFLDLPFLMHTTKNHSPNHVPSTFLCHMQHNREKPHCATARLVKKQMMHDTPQRTPCAGVGWHAAPTAPLEAPPRLPLQPTSGCLLVFRRDFGAPGPAYKSAAWHGCVHAHGDVRMDTRLYQFTSKKQFVQIPRGASMEPSTCTV